MEIPDLEAVVPGLITEGLNLLIGAPNTRKSWLVLVLSLAVCMGRPALGAIPVVAGDVLLLALEDNKRRMRARIQGLGAIFPSNLHIHHEWPALGEGCIEALEATLDAHPNIRMVIIDTIGRLWPRASSARSHYQADVQALAPLQQLALRRRVAVLAISHRRKTNADDWYDLITGSAGIGATVDQALFIDTMRGDNRATLCTSGRDTDNQQLALYFDLAQGGWVLIGDASTAPLSPERAEILRLLVFRGSLAPREVASALGKRGTTVRRLLTMMRDDGLVEPVAGVYQINEAGLRALDAQDRASAIIGRAQAQPPVAGPDMEQDANEDVAETDEELI